MSKRAEQKALEAYPAERGHLHDRPFQRDGFVKGYEQAEKNIIAIVKQYLEKGERCMEQEGESQIYAFWDGFHNCAENILRELKEK